MFVRHRGRAVAAKEIPALIEHGTTGNGPLTIALYWMQANRERLRKLWT